MEVSCIKEVSLLFFSIESLGGIEKESSASKWLADFSENASGSLPSLGGKFGGQKSRARPF